MGHYISGIVSNIHSIKNFASSANLHSPSSLINELAFLPLSDSHLDALFPVQGQFDDSMMYLSDSLKKTLAELSADGLTAYFETEYFGGQGAQSATVYNQGKCIFGPTTSDDSPISDALKLFGVVVCPGQHDEFEAVGFCRHRNNDDWIEEQQESMKPK